MKLDNLDRKILNMIQTEFPLEERPFQVIAERLETDEDEVLRRVRRLTDEGIVRQISAIFDSRRLGYKSTLVAMKAPADHLDDVAAKVSAHPGVSHNYARNHDYNLWFTITVAPGQQPAGAVAALAQAVGVKDFITLPALRTFKIGVSFDMEG